MKTAEAARHRWYGICKHFGIPEHFLTGKHQPCVLCGGKDRARWDDKDGSGSYICSHCGAGDGFKLIMGYSGKSFADVAKEIDEIVGNVEQGSPKPSKPDPVIRLQVIAKGRAKMDGINPVRTYLKSRGLTPVSGIEYSPRVTHWHDGAASNFPAMVCLITGPTGAPLSYHITYLSTCGSKADIDVVRKILPPVRPLAGSAIRLGGVHKHIGIAEGVETALAVTKEYNIPCWAAATAVLLEKFQPPEGVEGVSIYGDNDANYTGQKAAYTLASRLADKYITQVFIPTSIGSDFADEIFGEAS